MRASMENRLVKALTEALDKLPLATWTTAEQLADASPFLQKEDEGHYTIVGESASVSPEDLENAEFEVMHHAEEAGMFVDCHYECGFSVHEYVSAGEFAFSSIETMLLTLIPTRCPFDATEIKHDGTTLAMTKGWENSPNFEKIMVAVEEEERNNLRRLIERVDLPHWNRKYRNNYVLDGWDWNLVVWFKDKRVFASEGSNEWPDMFGELWDGLHEILGIETKWECPL